MTAAGTSSNSAELTPMQWLMAWYRDRRGGNWDNFNGLTIWTSPHNVWYIGIALNETPLEGCHLEFEYGMRGESEGWYAYRLNGEFFEGQGDAGKLDQLITAFRRLWEMAVEGTLKSNIWARRKHEIEEARHAEAMAEFAEDEGEVDELAEYRFDDVRTLWSTMGIMTREEERRLGNWLYGMDRIAGFIRALLREQIIPATLAGDRAALRSGVGMYGVWLRDISEFRSVPELRRLIEDLTDRLGAMDGRQR